MGKKDKGTKQKGSLKKIITFLMITHPIEALIAARKAKKLGLNHRRWFLATLLFGVFASSRMKEPVVVEVEVEKAPEKRGKKAGKEKPAKQEKVGKKEKAKEAKIVIEVIEEPTVEIAGTVSKGSKAKKGKKDKKSK